jgi:MarR-like DNA-binding transcriptional regulator SgrR of sgrS sRNA
MKPTGFRLLARISLLLVATGITRASTNPHYGGTLRVELEAARISFDPREWEAGSPEYAQGEKIAALIFDRILTLDNYGRFQPQLATEWSHDAGFNRWQFTLRAGVRFSDGSELTAADAVAALRPLLPSTQQILASGNNVVIQSSVPMSDLLEELSSGHFFVYRVQPDGTLLGTGPFFVVDLKGTGSEEGIGVSSEAEPTTSPSLGGLGKAGHLRFRANEKTWSGRPFVDAIDVTLGLPALRELFDLQLGKADLVELSPDVVRRATQENLRVWSSTPVTLYGVRFDKIQPAASNSKLREAVSLLLDRQTMANVLLQKQAEAASALLPGWLSGYAFLFNMDPNIEHAKEIRAALPANIAAGSEPLRLRVDAPGDLAKLLGERVAVNARQASIAVQMVSHPAERDTSGATIRVGQPAGLHLFAWHYTSLSPRVELDTLVSALSLDAAADSTASSADPEHLYVRERKLLEDHWILPLVALPEYAGLGPNLRDWMPARWGEWHLADVWLDLPDSSTSEPGTLVPAAPSTRPRMAATGAKP